MLNTNIIIANMLKRNPSLYNDLDKAMIVSKVFKRRFNKTPIGTQLVSKAGTYLPNTGNTIDTIEGWESIWQERLYANMRQQLLIASIFRKTTLGMETDTLYVPDLPEVNTEATWVDPLDTSSMGGTTDSTGSYSYETVDGIELVSKKLAAKTYVSNDDDENFIGSFAPIIARNLERAMAKAIEEALLNGTGTSASDPIKGLYQYAVDESATTTSSGLVDTDVTDLRRMLGMYGKDPTDLILIISESELQILTSTAQLAPLDKRTRALYSKSIFPNARYAIQGIPIITSPFFPAADTDIPFAILVRPSNFLLGESVKKRLETEYQLENYRKLFVSTMRLAFTRKNLLGVSALVYPAADGFGKGFGLSFGGV